MSYTARRTSSLVLDTPGVTFRRASTRSQTSFGNAMLRTTLGFPSMLTGSKMYFAPHFRHRASFRVPQLGQVYSKRRVAFDMVVSI